MASDSSLVSERICKSNGFLIMYNSMGEVSLNKHINACVKVLSPSINSCFNLQLVVEGSLIVLCFCSLWLSFKDFRDVCSHFLQYDILWYSATGDPGPVNNFQMYCISEEPLELGKNFHTLHSNSTPSELHKKI